MKYTRTVLQPAFLISVALLVVSCGGGGDNAGDVNTFTTSPKDVSITGKGSCSDTAGDITTFLIIGGKAPFRVVNSSPQYLRVDKTEVTGKDPQFTVTTLGGCGSPITLTVLDYHSRSTIVEYKIEEGSEAVVTP